MPRALRRLLAAVAVAVLLPAALPGSAAAQPDVAITSPADGATVHGKVRLDADAPGADRVEYFANGIRVAQDKTGSDWSETWDTRAAALDGTVRLVARADGRDLSGAVTVTVANDQPAPAPPSGGGGQPPAGSPEPAGFPACPADTVRPYPAGTTLTSQWRVSNPPDRVTYDLTGVRSTAYPAGSASPFSVGGGRPGADLCLTGGVIEGSTDDARSWDYYHDQHNASCVRLVATRMVQANGLRCRDVEDGLKFLETSGNGTNLNTTTFYASGVWLDRIRDDCVENDYTLPGVLHDSLFERCNTGISERPSSGRSWATPAGEQLILDHMLIGLWSTPHDRKGLGSNALFKWSTSGNRLVIRCSVFLVPARSLNGADAMALPPGTVVDDAACPGSPSTIVWLGGGPYPGDLRGTGIRVTADRAVWDAAVAAWKARH